MFILLIMVLFSNSVYSQSVTDKEYIFDDFKYNRLAFPATGDSSSSIFGKNPWITKKGIEYARAWRRYEDSKDSNSFRKGIDMGLDSTGFSLGITKEYNSTLGYGPMINSDFVLQEGTFAARIKFSKFKNDKIIQAFFQFSPVMLKFGDKNNPDYYWAEYDFELNNCWNKDDNPKNKIGSNNFNGKLPLSINIDCITKQNGKYYSFEDCTGSFEGHQLFEENWLVYVFRANKLENKMEIEAFSDDDSLPFEIWAGFSEKAGNWGRPFTIPNYFPQYRTATYFSIGACSNITEEQSFKIDWFFYSPNPNLSASEILEQVGNLKKASVERINTTQFPTFTETTNYAPDNLVISGPLTASVCVQSKWALEPLYKGRNVYNIDFKYRIYSKGSPDNWINIYKPEFEYLPSREDDSLEIMVIYQDQWEYGPDTLYQTCIFQKVPCGNLNQSVLFSSIYPNPADENLTLEIEILLSSEISLELFDKLGYKISDIYKGNLSVGNHQYEINISELAEGTYYIRAITPVSTEVCKFIKLRY